MIGKSGDREAVAIAPAVVIWIPIVLITYCAQLLAKLRTCVPGTAVELIRLNHFVEIGEIEHCEKRIGVAQSVSIEHSVVVGAGGSGELGVTIPLVEPSRLDYHVEHLIFLAIVNACACGVVRLFVV